LNHAKREVGINLRERYYSGSTKFFLNGFVETGTAVPNPVRYRLLRNNQPVVSFLSHLEHDAVAAIVADINSEQFFMETIYLSEIEFPQPSFGFDQFGKLDIPVELNNHGEAFSLY
jgi:hypothetical protein